MCVPRLCFGSIALLPEKIPNSTHNLIKRILSVSMVLNVQGSVSRETIVLPYYPAKGWRARLHDSIYIWCLLTLKLEIGIPQLPITRSSGAWRADNIGHDQRTMAGVCIWHSAVKALLGQIVGDRISDPQEWGEADNTASERWPEPQITHTEATLKNIAVS